MQKDKAEKRIKNIVEKKSRKVANEHLTQTEDVACFIIKVVLTIVQMVIFSGALIGFTMDVLQNAIDRRMENLGKLNLKNHFVFLNWSTIGPNIIHDLSYLEGEKIIVILSEKRAGGYSECHSGYFYGESTENEKYPPLYQERRSELPEAYGGYFTG